MNKVLNKDNTLPPWLDEIYEAEDEEGFREEVARSYEVLKKLLPFMAKRCIPATPKNFQLFYDYVIFVNPQINKVVNELLDKGVKFNSQVSSNLYTFFYSGAVADLKSNTLKAANTFISLSDSISENLKSARDHSDHFHEVLASTSRQMSCIGNAGELQPHLENLLAETEQALAATDLFSCRIKEANDVIVNLKEELRLQTDLANIDELTRLGNRRRLSQEGPRLIREAVESGRPLSAIVFDIDWFKAVNDTWGHIQGDKVLKACAGVIMDAARSSDLAVRLGGEEFLLLCPNINLATAAKVADRVRQSIAATEINLPGQSLSVTVSAGAAEYSPGEDITALVARADAALYLAKAAGRNRIHAATRK
jgi:diguanylate cyclase